MAGEAYVSIVEAQQVTYRYIRRDDEGNSVGETTALSDITFSTEPGEFLAILGHNGSGKSTLARHLNALLLPAEGAVLVDGMNTRDPEKLWDVRRLAGMVFQNPDNQIIGQVVEEDVAFGPENLGVPTEEIRTRVDEALDCVGMQAKRTFSPNKLSGGQKQRVSIAGILAMKPRVLLLDEPTAMLDPAGREEVLSAVHALNRQQGITVILITHDMNEAAGADRILVMDRGKIAMIGTPREIFAQSERLYAMGLSVPFATEVAGLLRARGIPIEGAPITQKELVDAVLKAANIK